MTEEKATVRCSFGYTDNTWQFDIVGFVLNIRFVDSSKNMKYHQRYPLRCVFSVSLQDRYRSKKQLKNCTPIPSLQLTSILNL